MVSMIPHTCNTHNIACGASAAQHITSAIVLQVTADGDDQRKFHVVLHRIFDHKYYLQSVTARSRAGQCRASEESFAIDHHF